MKDRLLNELAANRPAGQEDPRRAGLAVPVKRAGHGRGGRFAWRVLSLVMVLTMLLNSVSFAVDGTLSPVANTAQEDVSPIFVDDDVPEQETELDSEVGSEYGDDLPEKIYAYEFQTEKTVLLSQIFAMYMLPVLMQNVETVLMPGSEDQLAEPSQLLMVEPLEDENQKIYDYRITALQSFEEARLTVYLTDDVYTLVMTNPPRETDNVDLSGVYGSDTYGAEPSADESQPVIIEPEQPEKDGFGTDAPETVYDEPVEVPTEEPVEAPTGPIVEDQTADEQEEQTEVYNNEVLNVESEEGQTEVSFGNEAEDIIEAPIEVNDAELQDGTEPAEIEAVIPPVEEAVEETETTEAYDPTLIVLYNGGQAVPRKAGPKKAGRAASAQPSGAASEESNGAASHNTESLRLSLDGGADARASLRPIDLSAPDYMQLVEAYAIVSAQNCACIVATLIHVPSLAEGEYLALYGIRDGALAEKPLSDAMGDMDRCVVSTEDWDGFALVRLGLTAYQQLPAASMGRSLIELSGTLPVDASVSVEPALGSGDDDDLLLACDISIVDAAGNEFAPLPGQPIEVTVRNEAIRAANEAGSALSVSRYADGLELDGVVEILRADGDAVTFAADSCAVYAVREIVLEKDQTASDGNTYRITVAYDTASGIPADAALVASEIPEGTPEYAKYVEKSAEKLGETADDLAFARAFDITLKNPETGEEYQPFKDVQVTIELLDENLNHYANVEVVHIHSVGEEQVNIMDSAVYGESVEFETTGFSVYVLIASGGTETGYDTLNALVEAAQDGDTVKLAEDATGHFSTDKTLTLDLDGHTLTVDAAEGIQSTGGTLTITNGAITSDKDDIISANGGAITLGNELTVNCSSSVIYAYNGGSVVIDGADVTSTSTKYTGAYATGSGSNIEVKNGSLSKTGSNKLTLHVNNGATAQISGGTVTNDSSSVIRVDDSGSSVTISGGSVSTTTSKGFCAVYSANGGTIKVSGGNITAANNYALIAASKGIVNVSGGTITGAQGYYGIMVHENDASTAEISGGVINGVYAKRGTTSITGGTFTNYVQAESTNNLIISGGVFEKGFYSATVADGYVAVKDENGVTHVGRALTIVATGIQKTYDGSEQTSDAYTAEGLTEGDTVESLSFSGRRTGVGTVDNVPSAAKIVNADGEDVTARYAITYVGNTLEVIPKAVTVTADDKSKTYGDADPELTATVAGLVGEDTVEFTVTRNAGEDVGSYAVEASGAAEQGNYSVTFVSGALTIIPKAVTVTADDKSKTYGDADPELTATVTGLVGEDTVEYALSRTQGENVGVYTIISSGEVTQGNYSLSFEGGILTISQKALTITADSDTKVYDGMALTKDSYTNTDLATGDSIASVTVTGSQAVVGTSDNVPSAAKIVNGDAEDVTANYNITYAKGTLSVIRFESLIITADSDTKEYDGAELTKNSYQVTGLQGGDKIESVVITGSQTLAGSSDNTPGNVKVVNSEGTDVTDSYAINYQTGTLTVTQRPLTIMADSDTKVYDGTALTKDSYTSSDLAAGDNIEHVTVTGSQTVAGTIDNVPSAAKIVNRDGEDVTASYAITYANGTLEVTKKAVAITADSDTKVYDGTALTKDSYTGSDLAAGDNIEHVTVTGSQTVVGTSDNVPSAAKLVNADGEDVTASYEITYENGTLKVTLKPVTVIPEDKEKIYGDADPAMTAKVTGLIGEDTVSYTLAREIGEDVGKYAITGSGEAEQGNYSVTYEVGALNISQRPISVTITGHVSSLVYDGDDHNVSGYDVKIEDNNATESAFPYKQDYIEYDDIEDPSTVYIQNVGKVNMNLSETKFININDNYRVTFTIVDGYQEIVPRPIVIKAEDKEKVYGEDDPLLEAEILYDSDDPEDADKEGLISGDGLDYTLIRAAGEAVGVYAIMPSAGESPLSTNYTVRYDAGSLTIHPAPVTVTVVGDQKTYGEEDPEAWDVIVEGLKNGEAESLIRYTVTREAGEDAGEYAASASGDAKQGNYTVAYVPGIFTILRAPLTISANPDKKIYGEADPILEAEVIGLMGEDSERDIRYELTRDAGENAGEYAIRVSGDAVQGNYDVTYQNDVFTILPKQITVRADDIVRAYGDADPELTATLLGQDADDTVSYETAAGTGANAGAWFVVATIRHSDLEDSVLYNLTREAGSESGDYSIEAAGETNQGNYEVEFEPGTFTISPKIIVRKQLLNEAVSQAVTFSFRATLDARYNDAHFNDGVYEFSITVSKAHPAAEVGFAVPQGASVTVEEIEDTAYTTTATLDGESLEGLSGTVESAMENSYTFVFNNERNAICKIDDETFTTISAAVQYAGAHKDKNATIEMLCDYTLLAEDAVTIPKGYNITLTTAEEYPGEGGKAAITRSDATADICMFTNQGALTLQNIKLDGASVEASRAIIANSGTLTVGADAEVAGAKGAAGGAINTTAGEVNVNNGGSLIGNDAANGGAIFISGGAVNINQGDTITGNRAEKGGAIYVAGGTLNINDKGKLNDNTADMGGAIYVEGGTVNINGNACEVKDNRAANGGALYATGGTINVSKGYIQNNTATTGDGGAFHIASGAISVTGGELSGNMAENGNGGAIYVGSATAKLSGGLNIKGKTANSAINGAAVYVASGVADITGAITGNIATDGGAVGVGSASARLNFSGGASVADNTMNGAASNVYLNVDSDEVINSSGLSGGDIGIYVPGDADSDLVLKRGDICGCFGSYANTTNIGKFKNDRHDDLYVFSDNGKLYWGKPIDYEVNRLDSYATKGFPPQAGRDSRIYGSTTPYYPRKTVNQIYNLVTEELYPIYKSSVPGNLVYAYTFGGLKGKNTFEESVTGVSFEDYAVTLEWDWDNRVWRFKKRDGSYTQGMDKMYIYYSSPAYLSITNNTDDPELVLNLTKLEVLGRDEAADGYYGYVTARNGATAETLNPIQPSDLVLAPGQSIKLLFPGAAGQAFALDGVFTGTTVSTATVPYIVTGWTTAQNLQPTQQDENGLRFALSGNDYKLPSDGTTKEIVFGEAMPICKIGNVTFPTLKKAMEYAVAQKKENGGKAYKIEMLVDYLQPKTDVLDIPDGFEITLTTADKTGDNPYTGSAADGRATLSRDAGNTGAMVISNKGTAGSEGYNSKLIIENLVFDGRDLGGSGNGGAVNTKNAVVEIKNSLFKGFEATNGGAIYIDFTTSGEVYYSDATLTVTNSDFIKCRSSSSADKTGGGALWTTANKLTLNTCAFDACACYKEKAQGGAVFHNIKAEYSKGSTTHFINCTFKECYVKGAAAGAVESDALDVVVEDCRFEACYSDNRNGGAINIYANNAETNSTNSSTSIKRSTFIECWNPTNGGAIRCTSRNLTVEDSTFTGCHGTTGGAIAMTNGSALKLEIKGSTFDGCYATGNGGAIAVASTPDIEININDDETRQTVFKNCTAAGSGGGIYHNKDNGAVEIENCRFENCKATGGDGGGLRTNTKSLSIKGEGSSFVNCEAKTDGGGLYHNNGGSLTMADCTVSGCTVSAGNGGGICTTAKTVAITRGSIKNSVAKAAGGGIWVNPTTATFDGCTITGNSVTNSDGKGGGVYVGGGTTYYRNSHIHGCSAANGGGWYQNNGTLYIYSGSIQGSATNGGGLYQNDGNARVYHYGGIVGGTATANGGGVYKNSGNYTIGKITEDGQTTEGGTVGGGSAVIAGSDGTTAIVSSALNGGGFYQNNGTLNIEDGGTVGGTVNNAASAANGGCLYVANGTINLKEGGQITGSVNTTNGGGVYMTGGTFNLGTDATNPGGEIRNNKATNGGGVFVAGGIFYLRSGSIASNEAYANGGGVYKSAGTFTMYGGAIGGSTVNANTAAKGGGLFVADGQANTFYMQGGEITHNSATWGGGIAVGGSGAVLKFGKTVTVRNNKMGDEDCNVYLDVDSNGVIITSNENNCDLTASAYIGVYASDDQFDAHGVEGMPFGTYNKSNNLQCFINDRDPRLYGTMSTDKADKKIYWATNICKITDSDGNLLYRDPAGATYRRPAVFTLLYVDTRQDATLKSQAAFNALATDTFYDAEGSERTPAYVKMLVDSFTNPTTWTVEVPAKNITLTTASKTDTDNYPGPYDESDGSGVCVLRKGEVTASFFAVNSGARSAGTTFAMENITLDGGKQFNNKAASKGGLVYVRGTVALNSGTTLQHSEVTDTGGALCTDGNDSDHITISSGVVIEDCKAKNGGAVYLNKGKLELMGDIRDCVSTENGGGVYINVGTATLKENGSITGCSAVNGGGVFVVNENSRILEVLGGSISGNNATAAGGGIAVGGSKARLWFEGDAYVYGNKKNGEDCDVELNYDSNAVINVTANGLDADAKIGVFVPDGATLYNKHGDVLTPFGTYQNDAHLECFFNNRNEYRGGVYKDTTTAYWTTVLSLEVINRVVSDLADDNQVEFKFTVTMLDDAKNPLTGEYGQMTFDETGSKTFVLKNGESLMASKLPADATYTVTMAADDRFETAPASLVATGRIGALKDGKVTIRTEETYVNTRKTGSLTISKAVVDPRMEDEQFVFTVKLGDATISKEYTAVNRDGDTVVTFTKGVATLRLKDGESVTIQKLPLDMAYTVREELTDAQDSYYTVKPGKEQTGTIDTASAAAYTNKKTIYVCKITSSSGLMYYMESGVRRDAIYGTLEGAFEAINAGRLRTPGGSTTSNYTIEMLVPEYTMDASASLVVNKTVTLTTASVSADKYPYEGKDGVPAVVQRGFSGDSMIRITTGILRLNDITLDGNGDQYQATAKGGIIDAGSTLYIQSGATLRNSKSTQNGSAVYVHDNKRLYLTGGSVSGNQVTGAGGAIGVEGKKAKLYFSGDIRVENNTMAADGKTVYSNVYLNQDTNLVINANGMTSDASVGVYVAGEENATPYSNRGVNFGDFGTYSSVDNLHRFVNDRNGLTGMARTSDNRVVWLKAVPLTVNKQVVDVYGGVDRSFDFAATFKGTNKGYSYTWSDGKTAYNLREGAAGAQAIRIEDPEGSTEPSDSPIAIGSAIVNLPVGTEITLEEKGNSMNYYTPSVAGEAYTNLVEAPVVSGYVATFEIDDTKDEASIDVTNTRVVCKATDREGNLLYMDKAHTIPAVYTQLTADVLSAAKNLYTSTGRAFNGAYGIQMLVPGYTLAEKLSVARGKNATLTTAAATDERYPGPYNQAGDECIITRGFNDDSMIANNGNLTLTDIALDGGSQMATPMEVTAHGGIVNVEAGTLTIQNGATLRHSKVTGSGGAVYAFAGGTVVMTGGSIQLNQSAGIFLEDGAKLELSGSPYFDGNMALISDDYADGQNGGETVYSAGTARQDIYLAGAAREGEALASLALTGNLAEDTPAGSIWVWAESENHYYMLRQFAVLSSNFSGDVSEATYNAFRNARSDQETDCGGEYLRGQGGDLIGETRCVYWTGGFDFSFLKIDGFGEPLDGATFALYTAYTSDSENTPYQKGGADMTATSSDGSDNEKYPDPEDNTKAQAKGTVMFAKIAPKTYYMVETTSPEGYAPNTPESTTLYRVTIASDGTPKIERKFLSEEDDKYEEAYKVETKAEVAATETTPAQKAEYQYRIMNASTAQRKVILRKIDSTYTSLDGAVFEIFKYDGTPVSSTDSNGAVVTSFISGTNGVYFVDRLPYGTYYLHETTIPTGYKQTTAGDDGNWFILTVNENGVGYEQEGEADTKTVVNKLNPEKQKPN